MLNSHSDTVTPRNHMLCRYHARHPDLALQLDACICSKMHRHHTTGARTHFPAFRFVRVRTLSSYRRYD